MKKLILILLLLAACNSKDETKPDPPGEVCAKCIEANSGYHAPDFCGPLIEVETYVHDLKEMGAQYGQSWSCTIK